MRTPLLALAVGAAALLLSSCASLEQPYHIQGQYYFVSQKMCQRIEANSPTSITCYNAKGKAFYRQAMSPSELGQYNALLADQSRQIAANNAALAAQTQAAYSSMNNYMPQNATPVLNTGSSYAHCSTYGNQLSCSSPLPEANFACTRTDTLYICRRR